MGPVNLCTKFDVACGQCFVSDRYSACAILIEHMTLSYDEVKVCRICSQSNRMFCPTVVRQCPILDRGLCPLNLSCDVSCLTGVSCDVSCLIGVSCDVSCLTGVSCDVICLTGVKWCHCFH